MSCDRYERAVKALPIFANKGQWCKDGWGIGYYRDKEPVVEKYPEEALNSALFKKAVLKAKSNIVICHLRHADRGVVCKENCHPFKITRLNKDWLFVHNGSIKPIEYPSDVEGNTDSARIFTYLMDHISYYVEKGLTGSIYPAIVKATKKAFEDFGRNIKLNYILTDGSLLYVFSHYARKNFYFLKRNKPSGCAILVSTIKLTAEDWRVIPQDRLFVIQDGRSIVLSKKLSTIEGERSETS